MERIANQENGLYLYILRRTVVNPVHLRRDTFCKMAKTNCQRNPMYFISLIMRSLFSLLSKHIYIKLNDGISFKKKPKIVGLSTNNGISPKKGTYLKARLIFIQ